MNARLRLLIEIPSLSLSMVLPNVAGHAQTSDFALPSSTLVPNYDRVGVGQREALEGGAFVARTNDAGANWYNPAGLVQSEKTKLNASASAYEVTRLSLEGIGATQRSTRFSPTGTFFGGVVGSPIVRTRAFRLGFSYTKPVSWTPGGIDGSVSFGVPSGSELFGLSSSGSLSTALGGIAAGTQVAQRIRVGAGISLALTTLSQNQALSDRLISTEAAVTRFRTLTTDGNAEHLVVSAGIQWDVTSRATLGLLAAAPGLRLGGSSKIIFQSSVFSGAGSTDLAFRDESATFRYELPLRINAGGAVRFGRAEVELDLKYHGGSDPYELFSSEQRARLIQTDADGVPTQDSVSFTSSIYHTRSILNVAAGGNFMVSQNLRVHAGVFTDNSPVDDASTSLFRAVDLVGASTGVTLSNARLSGSIGVTASWGTADDRPVGPSLGGTQAVTRVGVRTLNLLFSIIYEF